MMKPTFEESILNGKRNETGIIYEGGKSFWKQRCTLDVFIIKHYLPLEEENHQSLVVELVAYDPKNDRESNRIYLDYDGIITIVQNSVEISTLLERKQENCLRAKKSFHVDVMTVVVQKELIANYVLSRLSLASVTNEKLEIALSPSFNDTLDEETGSLSTVIYKPLSLIAYRIRRKKSVP
jgi:aspartate 1-decarboxylase